jgi:quinol monooxygenase YgiN
MAETLHVIATLRARPGKSEELKKTLEALIVPTRKERGCLSYRLLENRENPDLFTFVEEWASDEALDAHFETDHFRGAMARSSELLAEDPEIRRCTLLGRGGGAP